MCCFVVVDIGVEFYDYVPFFYFLLVTFLCFSLFLF